MNKKTILLLGFLFLLIFFTVIISMFAAASRKITPAPTPFPSPTSILQESLQKQTEADINVANMQEEVFRKYPWYLKLPLQEKNYFVLFDVDKKAFKAKIYPQRSSEIPIDEQVESYKAEILEKFKTLEIDTSIYPIEWVIIPEP